MWSIVQSAVAASAELAHNGVQCLWFKRDLRVHDNEALQAAVEKGPVIAVYMLEPALLRAPDFDAIHWGFIADSLRDLQQNLNQLGLKLHIHFGDALSVLDALHSQYAFKAIWAHQETGNAISYRRDMAVHQWARDRRVAFTSRYRMVLSVVWRIAITGPGNGKPSCQPLFRDFPKYFSG